LLQVHAVVEPVNAAAAMLPWMHASQWFGAFWKKPALHPSSQELP
jgi:hypothetical protein